MYPRLFELGPITVYTYGVLLAAAYLLGLKFAMVRAKARGLDQTRVLDLGIYIIISALIGAKLLLLITDLRTFASNPRELLTLAALRRRVLRRSHPRGARRHLVYPARRPAAVDHLRRVCARHRPRPHRRAPRLPLCRLLLREADRRCRGRSPSPIHLPPPTSARLSTFRCTPPSCTRRAPKALILVAAAGDRIAGAAVRRAAPSGCTCCSTRSPATSSRSFAGDPRGAVGIFSTSQFISVILAPLAIAMLIYLARRRPSPSRRQGAPAGQRERTSRSPCPTMRTVSARSISACRFCRTVTLADSTADQGRPGAGRRPVAKANRPVKRGAAASRSTSSHRSTPRRSREALAAATILYEDGDLVVVNKPAGHGRPSRRRPRQRHARQCAPAPCGRPQRDRRREAARASCIGSIAAPPA